MGNRPDLAELREELREAAALPEPTERLLEVAAIVSAALADLRVEPVVVGGLALAYWSDSTFLTGDIDVVMPRPPELPERLAALGFEHPGREWVLPGYDVAFEAPGDVLEPEEEAEAVELASGRRVLVLSLEDLLLWRLRERVHWHVAGGFKQSARLLTAGRLDAERLERRAADEGLSLALSELRSITAASEAGRVVVDWELSEIGKRIERESYGRGA